VATKKHSPVELTDSAARKLRIAIRKGTVKDRSDTSKVKKQKETVRKSKTRAGGALAAARKANGFTRRD
jgi:hypothetical protein